MGREVKEGVFDRESSLTPGERCDGRVPACQRATADVWRVGARARVPQLETCNLIVVAVPV